MLLCPGDCGHRLEPLTAQVKENYLSLVLGQRKQGRQDRQVVGALGYAWPGERRAPGAGSVDMDRKVLD